MHRETLLPLVDIGSRKFEELCRDLLRPGFPHVVRTSLKRTSGVEQYGVDVEGFDARHDTSVVISAKCYHEIKAWDFKPWIVDFTKHLDTHWQGKGVEHFVLAVTHECNQDDMNQAAKDLASDLENCGIRFHLWNAHVISELLRKDKTLVDRYFGRYWMDAISAADGVSSPMVEGSAPHSQAAGHESLGGLTQQLLGLATAFTGQINAAMAERLEQALKSLRAGRGGDLRRFLTETQGDQAVWNELSVDTRAKALRALAMLHLRDNEVPQAREALDQADRLSPAPDASARTFLVHAEGSLDDALALLTDPTTQRETELKASLLLEAGRPEDALALLSPITGEAVTSEVLRLRAMAELLLHHRDKALNLAVSAQRKAPDDLMPRLTLGIVRLFSALADGVEPQLGAMPSPISPALVRNTRVARELLTQAAHDFDHLLSTVDAPLRYEVEIWKLAALLLHPERREEARSYARILLGRTELEPLAVAWALNFGVLRRAGRIKKALGDAVRRGQGSPSHLVVFALMCAGPANPGRGLAMLDRYARLFPDAQEFLRGWRAQFGDMSVAGAESYALAVHRSIKGDSNEPLLFYLDRAGATVENIVSGAEFLAWRGAWKDLNRLRQPLLSVGTGRTIELAATAALRGGKPEDCLTILKEGAYAFDGGRVPTDLIHLRIKANEKLGAHQPIIADLRALLNERDDPQIRNRLMDAYLQIGALPDFQAEAERALDEGRLDQRHALQVAYVLRTHAPETARRALRHAAAQTITPDISGALLTLAAQLGTADIQERALRILSEQGSHGTFLRFESAEEVLAFMERHAREYREEFQEWLSGRVLAVMAMRSDLKAYGNLFLAKAPWRTNSVGDRFPMLLLSGTRRVARPDVPAGRPVLRIDLSGLLLAVRLGILTEIEARFSVQLPASTAEALVELEAEFAKPDATVVAACQALFTPAQSAVRIVDTVPASAVALDDHENGPELRQGIVRALLGQAYLNGHLDRAQVAAAMTRLGFDAEDVPPTGSSVACGQLSTFSIPMLARAGVLEPLARTLPLYLSQRDADQIQRNVEATLHESEVRDRISFLRTKVAERLESGTWTSIPTVAGDADDERSRRMPPHMRCFMEVLAAQQHATELFWVEDRLTSHQRLPGALYVSDLLDLLEAEGGLAVDRRAQAERELREAGYAFLPLRHSEFLRRIEAAPHDGNDLIETPDLADLRVWFANEVDRLRHIELAAQTSEDGSIVGEARRMLDLATLARELLAGIWSNSEAGNDAKRARSGWVWTCLRFEQLPFLPMATSTDAVRHYVAMSLAHVLDLPLLQDLGAKPMETTAEHEFVDWFVSDVLEPLAKGDASLADGVAEVLASMLNRCLEPPIDLDDESLERQLARALMVKVQDFLELLPEGWRDRIAARHDLHTKLQHRDIIVLTIDDEAAIPAADFADAYAQGIAAISNERAAKVQLQALYGKQAEIEVAPEPDGLPSVRLKMGENRVAMDALTLALSHPDTSTRERALTRLPEFSDPAGAIRLEQATAIAAISDVQERFAAMKGLVEQDFYRTLKRLKATLGNRRTIQASDLGLPLPGVIGAFLRIPDLGAALEAMATHSVEELRPALDVVGTAARIAGLPASAPTGFIADLGAALSAHVGDVDADSPLFALLRLRALLATASEAERLDAGVKALVAAFERQGLLFVALVRHGSRLALSSPEWMALPEETKVSFLWVYADQITQALAPPGFEARRLAKWVRNLAQNHVSDTEAEAALPGWVKRLTSDFGPHDLAAVLVAEAIRAGIADRAAPETIQHLKEITGHQGASIWIPELDIVSPTPPAPACLWAGADPIPPMVSAGWIAPDSAFARRSDSEMATALLGEEADPAHPHILPALLSLVDIGRVDDTLIPRLKEAIEQANWEVALEPETGGAQRILSVHAAILARSNDLDSFRQELGRQAERCAAKWPYQRVAYHPGREGAAAAVLALLNTAYIHASSTACSHAKRMVILAESVRTIVDGWPNALRPCVGVLDSMVRQLDVASGAAVWPILLELRGRS